MPCKHCSNLADIPQEKSWTNIEQKDKMERNGCTERMYGTNLPTQQIILKT